MTSLKAASTSAEALYELLLSLLLKSPKTIEILPGDGCIWTHAQDPDDTDPEMAFSPFLFTEENLGVPQKVLYQLYLYAVGIFKSVRNRIPSRPTWTPNAQRHHDFDLSLIPVLVSSTSILILANPSHETALNARKLLVQMRFIDPHTELQFIASLLSSQHCAKHAELWYHRRWLLKSIHDVHPSRTTIPCRDPHLQFTSLEMLYQEFELVSRACELYPRNYFAWTHRVICIQSLLSDYLTGTDTLGFIPIFRREITGTKDWIARHISDYSAIHSILTLSAAAFQSEDSSLVGIIIEQDLPEHAMSLVREYPAYEALWMYIRSALSISNGWKAQQTQQFIDHFVQPLTQSQCPKTIVGDELTKAVQYAKQFLNFQG